MIADVFDDATDPTVNDLLAVLAEKSTVPWRLYGDDNLVIDVTSGWQVSIGFGTGHYCTNKFTYLGPLELRGAITVEVAIFKPDKSRYVPESFDRKVGVGGWIRITQCARIIDHIAER